MILNEIRLGTCGHHASSRTIMAKAYRAGFYWPLANEAAKEIVEKCVGCQFYANMSHKPTSTLKTIPIVWPFAVSGLDMIGPLRTGRSGFTHLLVVVDKFTKWIEAKPIIKKFRLKHNHQFHKKADVLVRSSAQHHHRRWLKF